MKVPKLHKVAFLITLALGCSAFADTHVIERKLGIDSRSVMLTLATWPETEPLSETTSSIKHSTCRLYLSFDLDLSLLDRTILEEKGYSGFTKMDESEIAQLVYESEKSLLDSYLYLQLFEDSITRRSEVYGAPTGDAFGRLVRMLVGGSNESESTIVSSALLNQFRIDPGHYNNAYWKNGRLTLKEDTADWSNRRISVLKKATGQYPESKNSNRIKELIEIQNEQLGKLPVCVIR